jgi:hypothetical protein
MHRLGLQYCGKGKHPKPKMMLTLLVIKRHHVKYGKMPTK